MLTDDKIQKIRQGIKINMRVIKFWAELIRKGTTNSWIHIKAYDNSIVDIRNVFRKLSLRVNRILRTNYGPFTMESLKNPGEIVETPIPKNINNYMYHRYKEKLQNKVTKLDETKIEIIKKRILDEQKLTHKSKGDNKANLENKNNIKHLI